MWRGVLLTCGWVDGRGAHVLGQRDRPGVCHKSGLGTSNTISAPRHVFGMTCFSVRIEAIREWVADLQRRSLPGVFLVRRWCLVSDVVRWLLEEGLWEASGARAKCWCQRCFWKVVFMFRLCTTPNDICPIHRAACNPPERQLPASTLELLHDVQVSQHQPECNASLSANRRATLPDDSPASVVANCRHAMLASPHRGAECRVRPVQRTPTEQAPVNQAHGPRHLQRGAQRPAVHHGVLARLAGRRQARP